MLYCTVRLRHAKTDNSTPIYSGRPSRLLENLKPDPSKNKLFNILRRIALVVRRSGGSYPN